MKTKCPNCDQELILTSQELEREMISFSIKYEGEFLQAETIGGIITNTGKLFKAIAKDSGNKIMVAFGGTESREKELIIKFLIMEHKSKKDKP